VKKIWNDFTFAVDFRDVLNTNKITIIHRNGDQKQYELKDKNSVAADIVAEIVSII
jgi:hypothetical protein